MNPINIFRVSRIRDEDLFNIAARHESDDHGNHRIRIHEIDSLRILVDALAGAGVTVEEFDGFYFGFIIPQIGKEFDLLKVTGKRCLNIELKSRDVTEENIHAQLLKNRHYLNHLDRKLSLFTVVTDTLTCYRLAASGRLVPADLSEIAEAVHSCNTTYNSHIEKAFSSSEYLISPESNPDKFLQKQYFLTPAQDQVKKDVLKGISGADSCAFFHVTGRPCTGKTLLIYDLARTLSETGRVLTIIRDEPSDGIRIISNALPDLDFAGADSLPPEEELKDYRYLLVDEALRLGTGQFDAVCSAARKNAQICIFSTDPDAVLTRAEQVRDIAGKIHSLDLSGEYLLSEKLRMNMEIHTFIMKLKHLGCRVERTFDFDDVSVNYAGNISEARSMIGYFRDSGFLFIDARKSRRDGLFSAYEEKLRSNQIAGREYDKVVMLMDGSFSYDEDGYLRGIPVPDPDDLYPNVFYPIITRVRERLVLVILDAPELLRGVLSIID